MGKFAEYLKMKDEAEKVTTEREIHNFIKKYKLLPMGMIKELQIKLDVINQENKLKGRGIYHHIDVC